jgi:hypothetical protein
LWALAVGVATVAKAQVAARERLTALVERTQVEPVGNLSGKADIRRTVAGAHVRGHRIGLLQDP